MRDRLSAKHLKLSGIALIIMIAAACSQMGKQPPAITHDGLHLVPDTQLAEVYLKPEADFSQYKAAKVEPCNVSFRKRWMQDQNSSKMDLTNMVTKKDMERIIQSLSDSCTTHFSKAMMDNPNFRMVDDASTTATLVLRPSVINLDINAPDIMSPGRSRSYTTSAGEMTLFLEIYDGTTNAILARVVDRREDRDMSHLEWTNSVTNKAEADRIFRYWTTLLQDGLNKAVTAR